MTLYEVEYDINGDIIVATYYENYYPNYKNLIDIKEYGYCLLTFTPTSNIFIIDIDYHNIDNIIQKDKLISFIRNKKLNDLCG